jgi:hypothetical protein
MKNFITFSVLLVLFTTSTLASNTLEHDTVAFLNAAMSSETTVETAEEGLIPGNMKPALTEEYYLQNTLSMLECYSGVVTLNANVQTRAEHYLNQNTEDELPMLETEYSSKIFEITEEPELDLSFQDEPTSNLELVRLIKLNSERILESLEHKNPVRPLVTNINQTAYQLIKNLEFLQPSSEH